MPPIKDLLVESSRKLTDLIVSDIKDNQARFDEIMELCYEDSYPLSMRAAWVAYLCGHNYPALAKSHLEKIISILPNTKVNGVKRCLLKLLIETPYNINEEYLGRLVDMSFSFVENDKEAIAVRAFSIDILIKQIDRYPEITTELIAILESIMPEASRGIKNKCQKTIKQLKKKLSML